MAFFARDIRVQTRQRETRLAVIESLRRIPIHKVVALRAIRTELSFVRILVAGGTNGRQTEETLLQIVHFNQWLYRSTHVRGRVALAAIDLCVLSVQHVARLRMIKFLLRPNPVNQLEIFAVMLGVALCAGLLIGKGSVQPTPAAQFARDLSVAARAVEHCRPLPDDMAGSALRRAVE